jgi:hypothetical protein
LRAISSWIPNTSSTVPLYFSLQIGSSLLASTNSVVTRSALLARRTEPATTWLTLSSRAIVGVSFLVPLRVIAELREITRSPSSRDRSAMISSVNPSTKYSLSGSGL